MLSAVLVGPGSSAVWSHCQPRTQGKPQQHEFRLRLPADTDPARIRLHQDLTLCTGAPSDPSRAVAEFERHRRRSRHDTHSARPTLAIRGFPSNAPLQTLARLDKGALAVNLRDCDIQAVGFGAHRSQSTYRSYSDVSLIRCWLIRFPL